MLLPLILPLRPAASAAAPSVEADDGDLAVDGTLVSRGVRLFGGHLGQHDVDSSVLAFEIASRACFREAAKKAGAQLLEPMMKVEVVTPEDYVGDVIGDLNSRRGQIQGQESRGIAVVINANVPLANMFKYVDNLRSMSQGRAQYTMTFDHYSPVPSNVATEIQAKYSGQK